MYSFEICAFIRKVDPTMKMASCIFLLPLLPSLYIIVLMMTNILLKKTKTKLHRNKLFSWTVAATDQQSMSLSTNGLIMEIARIESGTQTRNTNHCVFLYLLDWMAIN